VLKYSAHMAKEFGIPAALFKAKTAEFRKKHEIIVASEQVVLSDEQIEEEDLLSEEVTELFNSKILGYQKDYYDVQGDVTTEKKKKKEKPGNA